MTKAIIRKLHAIGHCRLCGGKIKRSEVAVNIPCNRETARCHTLCVKVLRDEIVEYQNDPENSNE